ncbi:MAG: fumarylacetoacetate hydrolase family protein [Burkholderiaceae bacterium]
MTDSPFHPVAQALVRARRAGSSVDAAGVAASLPDAQVAYAAQDAVARVFGWFDAGPPRHWKSGGATRESATHAPLPPAGVWASPASAGDWPFNRRGIEAEIALRLGRDVDAASAASLDDAGAAALIDAMTVSIEVVDSRWSQGFGAPQLCKLADLQSHGALVLGEWVAYASRDRDWSQQSCRIRIGAQPPHHYQGAHSMGDPLAVLPRWLRHATRDGSVVGRGTVVTTGSWCGILPAAKGDAVEVEFAGIGRTTVQL